MFKKFIFSAFFLASLLISSLAGELKDLPLGTTVKSPGDRFVVNYIYSKEDAEPIYRIQNNQSGKIYKPIPALPCYLIRWTDNSNNIVCVEMMSDGYHARIIHFDGTSWSSFYIENIDDENFFDSSVSEIKIIENFILITRVVRNESPNRPHTYFYYQITCLFDTETRKILKREKTPISVDDFMHQRYSLKNEPTS